VVAITGASSGIGLACAERSAGQGAAVVLGARRLERLEASARAIRDRGGRAAVMQMDVTRQADVDAFVALAVREFGRLDVMICNAGFGYYAPIDEDFGMVPYEAFLSAKPVITAHDAGGPLEIVRDHETGLVVAPDAAALAEACAYLGEHVDEAKAWGLAGRSIAERVTWDTCVDALLS